ncbi:MAG: FtsX-like permease family protein [Rudaea sp.]
MMPLLVVLQVALACAIACNALFLLQQRLAPILASDGIAQPDKLIVAWQVVPRGKPWPTSQLREVEMALRNIPGVTSVSVAGSLPMVTLALMNGDVVGNDTKIRANAALYIGVHLVKTLGLQLVAGRDFSAAEEDTPYQDTGMNQNGPVIVTRALAAKLFPGEQALGKVILLGESSDEGRHTVVGVIAHLMRNDFGESKHGDLDYTMLYPSIPGQWPIPAFSVRVGGANPETVRKAVNNVIQSMLGTTLVQGVYPQYETYAQLRDRALAKTRAAVWLLAGVSLIVLIVTLVGIMGMTGYWVQQRTRQIGIRRALGARRSDILRHLQIENLLVVGAGVALGLVAAVAVNLWLMRHYELTRLPWQYLPFGAALMLVLGQIAVLAPALRAAAVPPVVATRSV